MEWLTKKFRPNPMNSIFGAAIILTLPCGISATASGVVYENCPGFRHEVVIPDDYFKNVPDSLQTGNVTVVNFTYHIDRIKLVDEDKYVDIKFGQKVYMILVQGEEAACSKPPFEVITKVPF